MAQRIMIAVALVVVCLLGSRTDAVTLAKDGKSDYIIVLADRATKPEEVAASELQRYLQEVTGALLPIRREAEVAADVPQVLVGQSARVKQLLRGVDWTSLEQDGIVMKTSGRHLVLAGGQPRGTLYAVYTFLEDIVGCRWWSSTESYVPSKPTLKVSRLNVIYVPKLRYRQLDYRDLMGTSLFQVKMKINGVNQLLPEEYGGHYDMLGWIHTFYQLLPPEKYFAEHPEWYSEIKGKRSYPRLPNGRDLFQLCLTNEDMRKELTRVAIEWIKANPNAQMISISQNDNSFFCECPSCRALQKAEGSQSGPLIHFVNAVARDIERKYPNVLVETLAYEYTRKPPLHVKPRHNVVIRLCALEIDNARPLEDVGSGANRRFREEALAWGRISRNVMIYGYVANFINYLQPHPILRFLSSNLRFYVKNQGMGVYLQGDTWTKTGDFVRLKAWVMAHLLWNPSLNEKSLIQEFLRGYYGDAAPYMFAYLNLIDDALERSGMVLDVGVSAYDTTFLTLADMNEATRLFEQAEKSVVRNPVILGRVRRERIPLQLVWVLNYNRLKSWAVPKGQLFLGPKDSASALEEFASAGREFKEVYSINDQSFESYVAGLKSLVRPPAPLPAEWEVLNKGRHLEDLQDNVFDVANIPDFGESVDDAKASDGRAARMPGRHDAAAIKLPVYWYLSGKQHCYAVVRCEFKAKTGPAFSMGIYYLKDGREVTHITNRTISIEQIPDHDYHVYDLGVWDLKAGMVFFFTPPGNAEAVNAVYIDRMFLIREQ